jgi:hypothetical protein
MTPVRRDLHKRSDDWLVDELRMHMLPWGIRDLADLDRAAAFLQRRLRDENVGAEVIGWASSEGMTITIGGDAHPLASEWIRRAVWPLCVGSVVVVIRQRRAA